MNNLFTLIAIALVFNAAPVKAQRFTVAYDTVNITAVPTGMANFDDSVNNLTCCLLLWRFKIAATDFPTDWQNATRFCDPYLCFSVPDILLPGFSHQPELISGNNAFYMNVDFSMLSSYGNHFVTIEMSSIRGEYDTATGAVVALLDTALVTYILSKPAGSGIHSPTTENDIVLYPNPTHNDLNAYFNSESDATAMNIYNMTGRLVKRMEATTRSGTLHADLADIPQGLYMIRIENENGDAVAIRKFTKQ